MKHILTILAICICCVACKEPNPYCDKLIDYKKTRIEFMINGELGKSTVHYTLVRINNPKDWNYNEYFTGNGFSENGKDVMRVSPEDTCLLKQTYFEWYNSERFYLWPDYGIIKSGERDRKTNEKYLDSLGLRDTILCCFLLPKMFKEI